VSSADGLDTVVAEAGSDVSITVRPRDRFGNSIGSDDLVFELDMRLSSVGSNQDASPDSPDAWTFTAPAYDLLVSTGWTAVYEVGSGSTALGVARCCRECEVACEFVFKHAALVFCLLVSETTHTSYKRQS
jgi:hypothetical protein